MAEILKYIEKRLDELGDNNPSELTPEKLAIIVELIASGKIKAIHR